MSIPHGTIQTHSSISEKPMSLSQPQQGYKMHPPPSLHDLLSKETSTPQSDYYDSELGHPNHHHGSCPHRRQACRSRRYLIPMIIGIIVSLIALGMLSCAGTANLDAWLASLTTGGGNLVRRTAETTAATATDGSGSNPIIDKKYYLIIIFVGLVLVIFAGIMLSAWCCKGAFRNPLCCPCYLCACCGGLACLAVVYAQKASSSWPKMVRQDDFQFFLLQDRPVWDGGRIRIPVNDTTNGHSSKDA